MKVADVMTADVQACASEDNLAQAAMLMWEHDCGAIPIINDARQVTGIITDRDICMALATRDKRATEIKASEVAAQTVHTCRRTADIQDALVLMQHARVRRLPVVDETGALCGILSINDIVLRAKKGHGKKSHHIPRKDVLQTLKALCEHRHSSEAETEQHEQTHNPPPSFAV